MASGNVIGSTNAFVNPATASQPKTKHIAVSTPGVRWVERAVAMTSAQA
jgi:hypothetical protein